MYNLIKTQLQSAMERMANAQKKYHREHEAITLIAVSKKQPIAKIQAAIAAGQRHFAESYVQESLTKIQAINNPTIIWHFIGPIQSNKAATIAQNFSWVHSLCRVKIAQSLNQHRPAHLPPLNVCLQVNISNESSKSGIALHEIESLANTVQALPQLCLRGLMCIPEATAQQEKQRAAFKQVQDAFLQLQQRGFAMDTLSMGMSNDLEAAIAQGTTMLRIGTAIFGPRY